MRLFISYNKKLFADGLHALLNQHSRYEVVGMGPTAPFLLDKLRKHQVDLWVVELDWPTPKTISYLQQVQNLFPELKTLLISNLTNSQLTCEAINTGINSYILKCCDKEELFHALEHLSKNEEYFSPPITQLILKNFRTPRKRKKVCLTTREIEVLRLLTQMHTNQDIAKKLSISKTTVKTHRQNIMQKFGAHNLIALIRYACRENLLQDESGEFCQTCPHKIPTNCNNY